MTHQICSPNLSTPLILSELRISAERLSGIRERDVRQGTFLLTLACPVDTTLRKGRLLINHGVGATSRPRSTRIGWHSVIHFPLMYTISETWFGKITSWFAISLLLTTYSVDMSKTQKYQGFEFMEPLVTDMVQNDPMKRPTMDEVVTRFSEIRGKLSTWKLRSRIARKYELWPVTAWKSVGHWYCTVGYILGRKAAIPEPK